VDDDKPEPSAIANPANRESFMTVEAKAREVLRERGLTEEQIEVQLRLAKRQPPED
jgi:hypothetical protein